MSDSIKDVNQLEDMLSEPTSGLTETLAGLHGDILILGAGGKMGPSLARMAKRASEATGTQRRIIAVDVFPSPDQESKLQSLGIETLKANLLERDELQRLPDAPNVVFMVGMKFGSTGQEALTWAINSYLPGAVCEKYASSRIAAFSTGNVYGLTSVTLGGSVETDPPCPVGEYAISALGRERIFEHFSRTKGTPVSLIRLNYAVEMRYGVLADIAQRIWSGEPVDLEMGNANVIWQADAVGMALQSLAHAASPPFVVNVAGPETLSVRRLAIQFGELMGKPVSFSGTESPDALLSNGQLGHSLFGYPRFGVQQIVRWTADWVMWGGESLGKPTHFESTDGKF